MTIPLTAHAAAVALVALDILVRALRARVVLGSAVRRSTLELVAVNSVGEAAAAVTPWRVGGEAARFVGLKRLGIQGPPSAVLLGVERLIDYALIGLVTLLVSASAANMIAAAVDLGRRARSPVGLAALAVVVALAGVSVVVARRRSAASDRARQSLRAAWLSVRALTPLTLAAAVALTGVSMLARVAILPVLVADRLDSPLTTLLVGSFALLYGQLIIPTPAGVGGVELGFIAAFGSGLPAEQLAELLVAWRLYTTGIGTLVGSVAWVRLGRGAKQLATATVLVGPLFAGFPAEGRAQGARLIPTDHWTYEYIDRLRGRGFFRSLDPLARPYAAQDIARELRQLDAHTLPTPEAEWVALLTEEFLTPPLGSVARMGGEALAAASASTSRRLDPQRPLGPGSVWPRYELGGWAESYVVAAEARIAGDRWLSKAPNGDGDPDGIDPGQRRGGRSDHAYVRADVGLVEVVLGRLRRNWSSSDRPGLLLSDEATPYPQLAVSVDLGALSVQSLTGELETVAGHKRYVAAHRLAYHKADLAVSLGEAVLYAQPGGGPSLRFLNPVEVLFFDHDNQPADAIQNLFLDAQFWLRRGTHVLFGEFMLDDIDVRPQRGRREPTLYALSFGWQRAAVARWLDLTAEYRRVSAWAYRTPHDQDHYTYLNRGLAENFADFDRLSVWADVYPAVRGLRVTPAISVQRQGEGNLRSPLPPEDQYLASPSIFLGVTQTTLRLGLAGRYQRGRFLWVRWDAGPNWVRNAGHQQGATALEFQAVAEAGIRFSLTGTGRP